MKTDNDHICEIFPPSQFVIEIDTWYNKESEGPRSTYSIYDIEKRQATRSHYSSMILLFIVFDKTNDILPSISIEQIKRGLRITGTEILQKMEEVAKKLFIKTISISDGSMIEIKKDKIAKISIPLAPLSILSSGRSWYNKMGYVTDNQEEVDTCNAMIIRESMGSFIDRIRNHVHCVGTNKPRIHQYITAVKNKLIRHLTDEDLNQPYLQGSLDQPVHEFFSEIKERMKQGLIDAVVLSRIALLLSKVEDYDIIKVFDVETTLYRQIGQMK